MASTLLPPGFRFHPTDVELIMYYLKFKVTGKRFLFEAISEINIYKYSPSDLPDKSSLKSKDREWFFFCPRERKYNSGGRMNRATENGYWKTTGKDRSVHYSGRVVGMIKTLVFYQGHPPKGERTDWVMHEYRLEDQKLVGVAQDAYVLCKVFHKNGPGPRNGAQYGAHFDEEEWDNDSPVYTGFLTGDPSVPCAVTHPLPISESSVLMITCGPEVSSLEPSAEPTPCSVPSVVEGITSVAYDDALHSISSFSGDASVTAQDDNSHEKLDHNNQESNIVPVGGSEGNDIFSGLPDLPNWQVMFNQASRSFPGIQPFADSYLELADLDIPLNSINNLGQQMPSQNYHSCGYPQFYNGSGSFSSTQYPLNSAVIQPFADSYIELADLDTPLISISSLEQKIPTQNYNSCDVPQFYYGVGSFSSTQHPPSSAEVQPSTDSFLDMADFDIPPSPIHNLVQMSTQNYNSHIDPQFYYEGGSSSSISYPMNSAQVPSLAPGPDGVGNVSNIPQVHFDGTTTASDANFTFWQPSEPMGINRFNIRG